MDIDVAQAAKVATKKRRTHSSYCRNETGMPFRPGRNRRRHLLRPTPRSFRHSMPMVPQNGCKPRLLSKHESLLEIYHPIPPFLPQYRPWFLWISQIRPDRPVYNLLEDRAPSIHQTLGWVVQVESSKNSSSKDLSSIASIDGVGCNSTSVPGYAAESVALCNTRDRSSLRIMMSSAIRTPDM